MSVLLPFVPLLLLPECSLLARVRMLRGCAAASTTRALPTQMCRKACCRCVVVVTAARPHAGTWHGAKGGIDAPTCCAPWLLALYLLVEGFFGSCADIISQQDQQFC
jgi:hypothetical protein